MYRVALFGSRSIEENEVGKVMEALDNAFFYDPDVRKEVGEIVFLHGGAKGVVSLLAEDINPCLQVVFKPWHMVDNRTVSFEKAGNRLFYARNKQIVENADVAFFITKVGDEDSEIASAKRLCEQLGVPVNEVII